MGVKGTDRRRMRPIDDERFWASVQQGSDDACWSWQGARSPKGYGKFRHGRASVFAHRVAFALANGAFLDEFPQVDHLCHNPPCCNPAHLRRVTQKQNGEHRKGPPKNNTSGAMGVTLFRGQWRVRVVHHGRSHFGGLFDSFDEAKVAVVALRNQLFTHNDHDRRGADVELEVGTPKNTE